MGKESKSRRHERRERDGSESRGSSKRRSHGDTSPTRAKHHKRHRDRSRERSSRHDGPAAERGRGSRERQSESSSRRDASRERSSKVRSGSQPPQSITDSSIMKPEPPVRKSANTLYALTEAKKAAAGIAEAPRSTSALLSHVRVSSSVSAGNRGFSTLQSLAVHAATKSEEHSRMQQAAAGASGGDHTEQSSTRRTGKNRWDSDDDDGSGNDAVPTRSSTKGSARAPSRAAAAAAASRQQSPHENGTEMNVDETEQTKIKTPPTPVGAGSTAFADDRASPGTPTGAAAAAAAAAAAGAIPAVEDSESNPDLEQKLDRAIDELKQAFAKEKGPNIAAAAAPAAATAAAQPVGIGSSSTSSSAVPAVSVSKGSSMRSSSPSGVQLLDSYNPLLQGCRSVEHYERIKYISEGAYGLVFAARNRITGEQVAIKQVKMSRDAQKEGFPITALRETNVLLSLHHPNIVRVYEMVTGSSLDKIYMVMEYFEADLKSVITKRQADGNAFSTGEVKCLMLQLLRAVEYLHRHWFIHRDLKTSNLLYSAAGKLAVCDFGLARKFENPIKAYTHMVVTLWYRPPELLLGQKKYSTEVDMWSAGCVFAEMLQGDALFMGQGEIQQLGKIFQLLGRPTEERWPGWSELPGANTIQWKTGTASSLAEKFRSTSFSGKTALDKSGLELLNGLLALDPKKRLSAADALKHSWFKESPPPVDPSQMPPPPLAKE